DLLDQLPALGTVVLDERDRACQSAAVAVEQALRERRVELCIGHRRRIIAGHYDCSSDAAAGRRTEERRPRGDRAGDPPRAVAAARRTAGAAALHARQPHAQPPLRVPDRALAGAEAALPRATADRR